MALAAVLLLALPGASEAATPRFGEPVTLEAATTRLPQNPALDLAPSGRVVVAWEEGVGASSQRFGIVVRRGTVTGRFGAAERVSRSGERPSVASGTDRSAIIAFATRVAGTTRERLYVVAGRRRGRFGRPVTIADASGGLDAYSVRWARGRFVVVWSTRTAQGHTIRYATTSPGGVRLGTPGIIATVPRDPGGAVSLSTAVAPDGDVVVAWRSDAQTIAIARMSPSADTFGTPQTITSSGGVYRVWLKASPGGVALSWFETEDESIGPRVTILPASGAPVLESPFPMFAAPGEVVFWDAPAIPEMGHPVASATAARFGEYGVQAGRAVVSERGNDGSYSSPVQLSSRDRVVSGRTGTVATRGLVTAFWRTAEPRDRGHVQYAVRSSDGAFGPVRTFGGTTVQATWASTGNAAAVVWLARPAGLRRKADFRRGVKFAVLPDTSG